MGEHTCACTHTHKHTQVNHTTTTTNNNNSHRPHLSHLPVTVPRVACSNWPIWFMCQHLELEVEEREGHLHHMNIEWGWNHFPKENQGAIT